jgi:hypothetical protein
MTKSLTVSDEKSFAEVVEMIQAARGQALAAVNTALIDLYWRIGEYISRKLEVASWGEGVVDELASYIHQRQPNAKGFTRANLFRMRQLYETYRNDEKVAPLVRQLSWSHNLIILGQAKRRLQLAFCSAPAKTTRWSSMRSVVCCRQRSLRSTKLNCPTRDCCRRSCTSSTR